MKKTLIILVLFCATFASAQIKVTKEGYPKFENKQPTTTVAAADTLMISKVDGIQMGIAFVDFASAISAGGISATDIDTLAELNAILTDATLVTGAHTVDTDTQYTAGTGLTESPTGTFNVTNPFDWGNPVDANIVPDTDTTYNIGAPGSGNFNNIYANEFHGGSFIGTGNFDDTTSGTYRSGLIAEINPADYDEGTWYWNRITNKFMVQRDGLNLESMAYESQLATAGTDDQTLAEVLTSGSDGGNIALTNVGFMTMTGAINSKAIYPDLDDSRSLGTNSNRWISVYSKQFIYNPLVADPTFTINAGQQFYRSDLGKISYWNGASIQRLATESQLLTAGTDDQTLPEVIAQGSNTGAITTTEILDGTIDELDLDSSVNASLVLADSAQQTDNSLSEVNQDVGANTRNIDIDILGALSITKGIHTYMTFDGSDDGYTTDLKVYTDPYSATWDGNENVPNKNDVYDKIETIAAGADSGQAMVVQTKAAATETFDNSDVVEGGVLGAKRMFTKFTGQNDITLDATITRYNQPFLLFHDSSSDSTLVKKGTSTIFKMAGSGVLAEDGFYFKNYETPTVIALASNEYLISVSNYSTYTEAPLGTINNSADTINEVDGIANTGSTASEVTWSSQSVNVQNGSFALRATKTGGTDNDASVGYFTLQGVTSGQNVTTTFYLDESSSQGTNWQLRAPSTDWDTQFLSSVSGTGYVQYVITRTAIVDNPTIRLETSSVGDLGDILDLDNVTWIIN